MTTRTRDEIRVDIFRLYEEPYSTARNAAAEAVTAEAEALGDRPLLVEALIGLVNAYNFTLECDKMFVPFATLLRMWDEDPTSFDESDTHQLYWMFKWVSSESLGQPRIPLAAVEQWHKEMRHRYQVAGHSNRAVELDEFLIAKHVGDTERAERAYAAWQAADRDDMSDCLACEAHEMAEWAVKRGDDATGLAHWRPVLDGEHGCNRHPHRTLAESMLPLVRLGRADQARAHHLRGYRLIRTDESFRSTLATHVEFCGRTGNEPRGLEILADQPKCWEQRGEPDSYLDWMAAVVLLMRRLIELGHRELAVPGPKGLQWTAATLLAHAEGEVLTVAALFDERNGNTAVSDRIRERMAAAPLLDSLPLGLRDTPLGGRTAAWPPLAAPAQDSTSDPQELLVRARQLSASSHPSAAQAWERARSACEQAGVGLGDTDRATFLDAAAERADPEDAARMYAEAAELQERSGQRGAAIVSTALAALHGWQLDGQDAETQSKINELAEQVMTLHAEGNATTNEASTVLLSQAGLRLALLDPAADPAAVEELDAHLVQLIDFIGRDKDDADLRTKIADATDFRARLVAEADLPAAAELLAKAIEHYHAAGRPWQDVATVIRLASVLLSLEKPADAEAVLTSVLGDPERLSLVGPHYRAQLHHSHAIALSHLDGRNDDAVAALLDCARWADRAGDSAGLGAMARMHLGGEYRAHGRFDEAAAVLEAAVPDLVARHGDHRVVQARVWLAESYRELEEHRLAAEQYLLAADIAQGWEDQSHHAKLAYEAGRSLGDATLPDEALRALDRAERLCRDNGDVIAVLNVMRTRAWQFAQAGDLDTAEALMEQALRDSESALASAEEPELREHLRLEFAGSCQQRAQLYLERTDGPPSKEQDDPEQYAINVTAFEQARAGMERATEAFRACGEAGTGRRLEAEFFTARLEFGLDRYADATARAERVQAEIVTLPDAEHYAGLGEACAELIKTIAEYQQATTNG